LQLKIFAEREDKKAIIKNRSCSK